MNTSVEIEQPNPSVAKDKSDMLLRVSVGIIVFILLLFAVPNILPEYWMRAVLMPILILGLAGLGLNVLFGYAGQASLGAAAFMAVGAFAAYSFMLRMPWVPIPIAFLLSGIVAGLTGIIVGLPSLRIKGFYLIAPTLTAQFMVIWIFTNFAWFYNYNPSLTISAPNWMMFGTDFGTPIGRYSIVVIATSVVTLVTYLMVHSQVGRNWMAVRDMDTAAAVIGVPIARTKLTAFFVSSFICGIAGVLWAFSYVGSIDAGGFNLDKSFQLFFVIIIGGLGSVFGSYIGAAFIIFMPIVLEILVKLLALDGLINQSFLSNMQKVIFGMVIIYLLIRQPEGAMKFVSGLRARFQKQ